MLALDNYHEVFESAPLHELLRNAASLLPPGVNRVILSRAKPLPCYARLRIHDDLKAIGFDSARYCGLAAIGRNGFAGTGFYRTVSRQSARLDGWAHSAVDAGIAR